MHQPALASLVSSLGCQPYLDAADRAASAAAPGPLAGPARTMPAARTARAAEPLRTQPAGA